MKKPVLILCLWAVFILCITRPVTGPPASLDIKSDKTDIRLSLFTPAEQEWIKAHQDTVFYVGVAQDYIPVEYIDNAGNPRGMGVELIKKVRQLTGLTFMLYPNSKNETWKEILQSTIGNRIDVLSSVSFTEERLKYLELSLPYMETTQVVVSHTDATQLVRNFSHIKTGTFAVPEGYWFKEIIVKEIPHARIIDVANMEEALQYVANKKADYTVCEIPVFTYYKDQGLYQDIKIVGELGTKNQIFLGARKDRQELIPIINKVIQHINYDEIYETSMVIPQNNTVEKRLIALVGLLGGVLIIAVYSLFRTFRKLIQSKKEAEKANYDKVRLVANISHDLRTPITVIMGYTQALIDGQVHNEDTRQQYIKKIAEKTNYLNAVVNDLFLLARLEDNNLMLNQELVKMDVFLSKIVEDMEPKAKDKDIVFSLHVTEVASVYKQMDRVKLYRAIENIMENAIAYTAKGGRIEVSAVHAHHGKIEIAVTDNGQGIDQADIPYVFDRYYKGKNARKESIGLGLYIAREMIHKHQGQIWVESEAGRGSTFYICM